VGVPKNALHQHKREAQSNFRPASEPEDVADIAARHKSDLAVSAWPDGEGKTRNRNH
jgi:hypothetical protein